MSGRPFLFVFAAMAVLVCSAARADPSMPMGFEAQTTNATGRTWKETGVLSQPYAMAKTTVRASMLGQGYGIVHDIDEGPNATRSLQLWRRADEDVILMLWQEDLYRTGLAWGISVRGDEGPEEEPSAEFPGPDSHAEFAESSEPVFYAERAESRPTVEIRALSEPMTEPGIVNAPPRLLESDRKPLPDSGVARPPAVSTSQLQPRGPQAAADAAAVRPAP